jgi:phospholipase/lecithinase/hemolysin
MKTEVSSFLASMIFMADVSNSYGQLVITKQPTNQTASLFADATFRVSATGTAPLSYQWRFNDADLIGMTKTSMTITDVQRTNAGNYSVAVTNLSGSVTSQVATLTITPYNSIYAFGFSWTDTRGAWIPTNEFWHGRASNGPLWPEYLSTNLGLAYVEANNYAYAGAQSSDVLSQVSNDLVTPQKPQLSLYCLWAGDGEFVRAIAPDGFGNGYLDVTNEVSWKQLVITAILNNSNAVNRLYTKGARTIVIQTQIDFSRFPASLQSFGANIVGLSKFSGYISLFNAGFGDAMTAYTQRKPDLRLLFVDMFSKLNDVLAHPSQYGFTKTDIDALGDPSLTDKSFTGPGADYVYWESVHPTSKFHELTAGWHLETLTNSVLEELAVTIAGGSPNIQMNHLQIGREYTLEKSLDLTNWGDVTTFTASAGTNIWQTALGNGPNVYIRLKWQR